MAWSSDDSAEQGSERNFLTKGESNQAPERASQIRTTCARAFWSEVLDDRMNKVESARRLFQSNKIQKSAQYILPAFELDVIKVIL